MAYRDVVLTDTPIDYYEFSEATGSTAASTGSAVHAGTHTGTTVVTGQVGNARNYNGSSDLTTVTNIADFMAGSAYSVEAWFKWDNTGQDYPTLVRRDGAARTFIIRGRANSLGDRPGVIEAFVNGRTVWTSTRMDDNKWHHVVVTVASTTVRLFVDGTEHTPASGTVATGGTGVTATYIGRGSGAGEYFKGALDEVAFYNKVLTPARISAHYAGSVSNAGYTAQVMTATAAMPEPAIVSQKSVSLVSADTYIDPNNPNLAAGNLTTLNLNSSSPGTRALFAVDTPRKPVSEEVVKPTVLRLYVTAAGSGATILVSRVTSAWTESATWNSGAPTTGTETTRTINFTGKVNTWIEVDVSPIVQEWWAGQTNYGISVRSSSIGNINTVASSESANVPQLVTEYALPAAVAVNAEPMTANVNMPEPTIDATDTVSVGASPMTATAVLVDPAVSTEAFVSVSVSAEPMFAQAEVRGGGFASPTNVLAEPLTASVEVMQPSVTVQRGVTVPVAPFRANAAWIQAESVNGEVIVTDEADDRYFQRVFSEFPKAWMRLNDRGSIAVDRMGKPSGTYHGVQTGRFNAPDNRHSVYFNGTASIEQAEPEGTNTDEALLYTGTPQSSLEFSFKTTKTNTFLMVSRDATEGSSVGASQAPTPARELYLRDGKISYRTHFFKDSLGYQREPYEFTGFKNLADGQWHSVVVKGLTDSFGEKGVEIWVDGKFEIRRTKASGAGELHGFPDWIGSRPAAVDRVDIGALPSSYNFVGEMSEVVFYSHLLTDDAVTRHFYDFMGYRPIAAEPMEAFAFMTAGNAGRGNQKRALALYFSEANDGYSIGGDGFNNKMNFNPLVGNPDVFMGYKMFYRSVDDNNGKAYRDPVTDAQTLLSLVQDVDVTEYDVIMFKEWPDEGTELDSINSNFPGALERLTNELLWARSQGTSLFITHPRLAVDLGIVDRVEFVETLKERAFNNRQGNAFGNYDYGSAAKFPWNIVATAGLETDQAGSSFNGIPMNTSPSLLENKAFFYEDMNFNNRFRVRALIEGLTDIPSYMISDAIYHVDYDGFGWQSSAFKYLHRYEGLRIGDEFIFHGTNVAGGQWGSWDYTDYRVGRPLGYFATPLANVKAGTVVTTFGATHWAGKENVSNPYKDYATTIVLKETDVLRGTTGGKIYVNFTEQPSRQTDSVAVQVLPANNADFPDTYKPDTVAQREWEWSDTRKTLRSTQESGTTGAVNITLPNGETAQISTGGSNGTQLTMTRSSNLFPVQYRASWQMNRRGLWWLGQKAEVEPGSVIAAAEPMTATATITTPVVIAQRDAAVKASPMVALAQMPKVKEDVSGDVDVRTLPLTATAEFSGFSKVIYAEPMTATATIVDNLEMVSTNGEQFTLYLHNVEEETLYLKEEV